MKKILWLIAGATGLKIVNEIGYFLLPREGVVFWKAFLPAFTGCLVLAFCLVKGDIFFEYSKNLGTKKLNQTYKVLIASFAISMVFMVTYYFANSKNKNYNLSSKTAENKTVIINNLDPCANQVGAGYFYRFKININNNTVLKEIHYSDNSGDHVIPEAYQNCNIADAKNWICNSPIKKYMVDGRFYIDWSDGAKELCVK